MDYIKLSKEVSYALRHHPEEYNLILDKEGFVEIQQLLSSLNSKKTYSKPITEKDLLHIISVSDKQRLEIKKSKIRALYGHSFDSKIEHKEMVPPDVLYHGTKNKALNSILINGILPMQRQYVHLSEDVENARLVGFRRDDSPVILEVNSKKAFEEGIKFYIGNKKVWLTDKVPPEYITILSKK